MQLKVQIDDNAYAIDVPPDLMREAGEFFAKMDRDMDRGWQMSRDYVDHPNVEQRCQIVADKLLTALMNDKKNTAIMMAGYILSRMPGASEVDIDTSGEMQNTAIIVAR